MTDDEINVVHRIEHHVLRSCPCVACVAERKRREPSSPDSPRVKTLPVSIAALMGYIKRSPEGSVASNLHEKKN